MKKFIALLFCLILGVQVACAEKLPPKDSYLANPEDYPVLFGYLNNYADLLFENFNPGILLWSYNWGCEEVYYIKKDGTPEGIPDFSDDIFCGKFIQKLVLKNLAPPFPKDLETDRIKIHLWVFKQNFTEKKISYWGESQTANITISKDHQKKQWFKKKTKK